MDYMIYGKDKMTKVDGMAWMSQMTHSVVICGLYGYRWLYKESLEEFGVLEPLRMALGHKEDVGTHMHMMIGHLVIDTMVDTPWSLMKWHMWHNIIDDLIGWMIPLKG